MSEYVVHGDDLKKIVRLGRRRPMPFAFCPSVGEDESLFATHRKKPPELIARMTRKESGQTKVAYGTFVILGKLMVLTCIKELPAIAKKLKKHMRAERLPLNVRVMDMSGREIEADIDAFDDGEDPFAGDDDDEEDSTTDGFVRWNAASAGPRPKADRLGQRIDSLKPAVLAAGGDRGDRLRDLLSAVIEAADGGRRDRAEGLIARLEREVGALMASSSRPQVTKPEKPVDTARKAAKAVAPRPDPEVMKTARQVATLRRRVARIEGDAGARLMAALALVAQSLRAGDGAAAAGALAKIEPAIDRAEAGERATRA